MQDRFIVTQWMSQHVIKFKTEMSTSIQCVKYNVQNVTVRKSFTKSTVPSMPNEISSRKTGTKIGKNGKHSNHKEQLPHK